MILAQRSAVPAVFSRPTRGSKPRSKIDLTREEKERLLRIGKRKRTDLFNAQIDTTQPGQGSALLEPSAAVKESGTYDVWMEVDEPEPRSTELGVDDESTNFIKDLVEKKPVKVSIAQATSILRFGMSS
jgi:nucleolar protein 53